MDYFDENENTYLKSSSVHNKRRIKDKKILKNKDNKETIFSPSIIIMIIILIIFILVFIFSLMIRRERKYFNNIIENLEIKYQKLDKNNSLLQEEKGKIEKINEQISKELTDLKNGSKKGKIVCISYGDESFKQSLEYNGKSALEIAKADEFYGYTPEDIDPEFKAKNDYILSKGRGNGYWLWKPYFLYKTLTEKLNDGDYLIYSDAGIFYVDLAQKLVDFLNEKKAEMYFHRLPHLEKVYTKRDAFILMGVDGPFYAETGQFNAAFQVYRKSKFTEFFLGEYLYYAQDKRIITDDQNEMGSPNYEGFRDHRHDQSILSLLTKKYGQVNANKTNLNIDLIKNYQEVMPTIFCHHRRRGFTSYDELKSMCQNIKGDI